MPGIRTTWAIDAVRRFVTLIGISRTIVIVTRLILAIRIRRTMGIIIRFASTIHVPPSIRIS